MKDKELGGVMNRKLVNVLLCIASGVMVVFSEVPVNLPWLCFVAYIPLLFVLASTRSFWWMFFYSWICMFVQVIIGFQWVHYVSMEFGLLSWWQALGVLIAFALFTNLSLQIFAVLYYLVQRIVKGKLTMCFYLLIIPSIFVLSEILDPKIFNWYIGNLLADYKYMFQFSSVFGLSGLSFLIILVNVLLYLLVKSFIKISALDAKHIYSGRRIWHLLGVISIFLFLNLYGYYELRAIKNMEAKCPKINVGLIQANIGNPTKLDIGQSIKLRQEFASDSQKNDASLILKKYQNMTGTLLKDNKDIDVIVWPETAFPGYYNELNPLAKDNTLFQKKLAVPFLIGGYYLNELNGNYYNSAILVNKGEVDFYHKKVLLPFGEFMPLRTVFPSLKRLVPSVGDFSRGEGASTLDILVDGLELRFAPTICYEILKADYVRQMVYKDAHVFLNLSNDSWFGTIEPYQHLKLARAKAVEFRRPIVRSTNTGVTSFIDMTGAVVKSGGLHTEDALVFNVPVCDHRLRSFYSGFGYFFPYFLFIVVLSFLYYTRKKELKTTVKKRRPR